MPQSVGSFCRILLSPKDYIFFLTSGFVTEDAFTLCHPCPTLCADIRACTQMCVVVHISVCACLRRASSKWIMHRTFELCIKKWNKIPQSSRFCPAVRCHGSQSLRFIWCSYNKLDFLGLVCTHIALNNRGPPCTQGWSVHLSRSA